MYQSINLSQPGARGSSRREEHFVLRAILNTFSPVIPCLNFLRYAAQKGMEDKQASLVLSLIVRWSSLHNKAVSKFDSRSSNHPYVRVSTAYLMIVFIFCKKAWFNDLSLPVSVITIDATPPKDLSPSELWLEFCGNKVVLYICILCLRAGE